MDTDAVKELTRRVGDLLDENTTTEISTSRMPNNGQQFSAISATGLATLRRSELVLRVARTDYSSYPVSPEDWE